MPETSVTVVTYAGGDGEMPPLPDFPSLHTVRIPFGRLGAIARALRSVPSRESLRIAFADDQRLRSAVTKASETFKPDVVYVERIRGLRAAADIDIRRIVLDPTDSLPLFYEQLLSSRGLPLKDRVIASLERSRLSRFESLVYPRVGAVVACTERDAAHMRATSGREDIEVLPNGVDQHEFFPSPHSRESAGRIVMTGNFRTLPNKDAAHWLLDEWPTIRTKLGPSATLSFAGSNPSKRLVAAHGVAGVNVTGFLPELRDAYWEADVAVVPVRLAVGTQNKLIEPMACGTAVVATPEAAAGLPADARSAITIAPRHRFAEALANLCQDAPLRNRLRDRAISYTRSELNWDHIAENLRGLLERVAAVPS